MATWREILVLRETSLVSSYKFLRCVHLGAPRMTLKHLFCTGSDLAIWAGVKFSREEVL